MIRAHDAPPHIDYLAKDFASFRQLMLDHLSVLKPDWTEQSAADLGNMLVELLAYAADQLSYYQDAVATEAYLGTARLRRSVRRHAQLLDYNLHEGCNARVWVHINTRATSFVLPKGTQLLTHVAGGASGVIIPQSQDYYDALAQQPIVFETMHDTVLGLAQNRISFAAHGGCSVLLAGATSARLRYQHAEPEIALKVGDVLIIEEIRSPATGHQRDADPAHRHAIRLTKVAVEDRALMIEWHPADALPFDLILADDFGTDKLEDVCVARGNMVLADHGRTIEDESLPEVPAGQRYRPHLRQSSLTYGVPYDHSPATARLSAAETVLQDCSQSMPAISLIELGTNPVAMTAGGKSLLRFKDFRNRTYPVKTWMLRRDLLSSGVFMRDYMVEMEDDGLAHLRFGFGEAGWQPAIVGAVLLATYRVGNGTAGNIGREALRHIVTEQQGLSVRNLLPAQGGTNPKRTDAARLHAPHSIKTWEPPASQADDMPSEPPADQAASGAGLFGPGVFDTQERCVTADDYAAVAMRHPRVAHAVAQIRWSGSWRAAVVYAQRRGNDNVSPEFRAELREFMEPFRMAGYDLDIQPPQFAPLQIELLVYLQPGHQVKVVRSALEAALGNRALEGGATGFFHPDNYTFGQPVHRSQLIACVMAVTGVAWVEVKQFRRMGSALDVEHIQPGPIEIARLDNDPRRPHNGILVLEFRERR